MRKFLLGLSLGLVAGVVVGVILSACGVFLWGKAMKKQEADSSALDDQIEQKAESIAGTYPSDAELNELAKTYLSDRHNFGLVIGILTNGHTKILSFGRTSTTVKQAPDGDSIFEIGSITKTFTGLALAIMAGKKEIALNDNLDSFLPPEAKLPDDAGQQITLKHLASQ